MSEVIININIGEDDEPVIKKKTRRLKNGKETVLEMPERVESGERSKGILDMIGI